MNTYNISHAPIIGLSGTQFSTLNRAGTNDPEGPEKYKNTEVKYGATFYSCHTALDTSNREKQNPKESQIRQNCKMLQARFA
jgi:hypothetical protein